jgi:hypothetical protein
VELYCGFPGCDKGKGGAKETAYRSTSGYSSHVKSHRDPVTNGPWVPPRPRVTTLPVRLLQGAPTQYQALKREKGLDYFQRGVTRVMQKRYNHHCPNKPLIVFKVSE